MKIDQLIYFIETANTQHIGKAAKILNISPSAISHSIKSLEQEIGHELFEKKGKSIYLTPHGQVLANRAAPLLAQFKVLSEEIQAETLPFKGKFKLACTHGLADKIIVPMVSNWQRRFPELYFEFYSLRSAQVVADVASGIFDMGFCFSPTQHPALTITNLYTGKMSIAVRKNHPLVHHNVKIIKELPHYPMVAPKAFQGIENCESHPSLSKLGLTNKPQLIFDSYDVAAGIIKKSNSWGLIPNILIQKYHLVPINFDDFKENFFIALITPKGRPPSRVLHKMVENYFLHLKTNKNS